jgi:NADPH-dependent 2,4-dienoyl-CoA reductase/sulfur reductase-like enzyme/nitrite reductase/ring-hydroxylating ferredoxin subunit
MAEHQIDLAAQPIREGEMRRLELEGKGVVLAHVDGQYYAFRAGCTHYGGPLDEGVLKGYTVMCPWHHACFDIRNGSRMEPPALNNLPTYTVRLEGQEAIVTLDSPPQPAVEIQPDNRLFVIIGGGAASNAAAEALRRVGFQGKITIISAVPEVPIDRPNLSKEYLDGHAKPEWMPLRDKNWYDQRNIELLLNTKVTAVNPQAHTITLADNNSIRYDKLLLATGGTPRHLNVTGMDLANVFTLRSQSDADAIIAAAKEGQRAVIIGASFIGMEVAASLVGGYKTNVTVVAPEPIPFAPIFGDRIGQLFKKEHEANGVTFRLQSEVAQLVGENGQVTGVQLKNGDVLPADFVVVGVGVSPATEFLKSSGLKLHERDGSVRVNANLQSSESDIYAAGDIARWDNGSPDGQRIEHWRVAQQHGIVVAQNMAGQQANINDHVPFFWTKQWDINLRSVGFAKDWDEIVYRGDVEAKNFIAFYVKSGQLQGAVSCKRDAETCAVEFILRDKMPLTKEQMANDDFDLIAYATG